jgi:hypothetical protein
VAFLGFLIFIKLTNTVRELDLFAQYVFYTLDKRLILLTFLVLPKYYIDFLIRSRLYICTYYTVCTTLYYTVLHSLYYTPCFTLPVLHSLYYTVLPKYYLDFLIRSKLSKFRKPREYNCTRKAINKALNRTPIHMYCIHTPCQAATLCI